MDPRAIGEFLGTAILVAMGQCTVANVVLRKSKAFNSGWIVITTGWAMAVLCGIFTAIAFGSPDAHLNPAVTLAMAISSGDFSKLSVYCPAQLAGAFTGAILVWLTFLPHWPVTDDPDAKLGIFATGPAIRNLPANLITEMIGTFVLVLVGNAMFAKSVVPNGAAPGLGPLLIGCLIWGIGLSMGGPTGYAINPARDLGPRIAHALLPIPKKRDSDWGYAPIPIVGPLIGASLAGLLLRLFRI